MSSQTEETCCVCGAPSTMRCSACSQAGVDVCFCSKEHQKLVWFAHKPVCGPPTADFRFPPELTPFESRILRSPTFRRTFSERRPRGTSAATFVQVIGELERECHLIPGSFMQNLHRMNEWLETLTIKPQGRGALRMVANCALSDFVHSPEGSAYDPLEMSAHVFALDIYMWHIWAGLLRILAGRVTVAGVDSSFVTPEFVRANLERLLQTIQADLDLAIDMIGVGLLTLVSRSLQSVPAMSRFKVRISTVAGDPASNRISVVDSADGSDAEPFAPTVR
ncbi:hypothetical protein C6P46_005885 [Rhodotorula mucilaginosa]|uniref:MYND-type domain-containing protein n=1 Tax=Rhodotorula mucilaginosa TaxID=5537 RepID=A0A9P7B4W2_RHOMI|nr:hypothetical protein C6P46_005885 [Rhodotorula mucilaginosa]